MRSLSYDSSPPLGARSRSSCAFAFALARIDRLLSVIFARLTPLGDLRFPTLRVLLLYDEIRADVRAPAVSRVHVRGLPPLHIIA